jgi:hypothetical protein
MLYGYQIEVSYINKKLFKKHIENFDFINLFNQLGWNYINSQDQIKVNDQTFTFISVAEKSGFRILVCGPDYTGKIPIYSTRMKTDRMISRLYREHLIIYYDKAKTTQLWQLVMKQPGKPVKSTETRWYRGQEPELLYQKTSNLFFTLDEEENITIVDVTQRVAENFHQNNEKVTKQFYDRFKKEHTSFLSFIKGVGDKVNKDWYASLMLNRLMFCYFVQKKGFLDNNINYLRNKLKSCQKIKGKNKFYSFYRNFLLVLFHQGLGAPEHSRELIEEVGRVPYLNGGLFDVHQLEKEYTNIEIDDKAFERIFDFFDQYNWHLDTRITASGKDINPDVIGYIFEKYINDRAQMGAYYTKEDITDYISKNCIIPYLIDEIGRNYRRALAPDSEIWQMMRISGDGYVYDAVKYGINPDDLWGDLPADVKAGLDPNQPDLVEKRRCWNRPAPVEVALPTEIWREVIERRKRYNHVKTKIENGNIIHINDFITYNLNIRQFAQDVVENTDDPDLLRAFYKALNKITILDPTCGSGAFLFAAMNILEPLYEACIQRMENFVAESPKGKYKFFEEILSLVKAPEHPNLQYFVYKSIILCNLYGVDIMNEAVEIAKLRLFLKLVATVEADYRKHNLGLEPLPDVDYNIRAGNTLIGFASEKELLELSQLDFDNDIRKIKEHCDIVARTFSRYKEIQLSYGDDYQEFRKAKEKLSHRLKELNHDLNLLLHKQTTNMEFGTWLKTHQPFHWFAEFYEITHDKGGFNVIIGNPPYVVYTKKDRKTKLSVADRYKVKYLSTLPTNNLYAFIIEQSIKIACINSKIGMIVPISSISSDKFVPLQKIFYTKLVTWFSSYSNRPAKLFENVEQRLTIFIANKNENPEKYYCSSSYKHWYSNTREYLFELMSYYLSKKTDEEISFSKVGNEIERKILDKLLAKRNWKFSKYFNPINHNETFFHDGPTYFIRSMSFMPNNKPNMPQSTHYRKILFDKKLKHIPSAVINSTIFYFFFKNYSNCRDFSEREIMSFPIGVLKDNIIEKLNNYEIVLRNDYMENKEIKNRMYDSGLIYYEEFYPAKSKIIIDKIDQILAEHYEFTQEEIDYIINYDIKYRMGKELEGEEAES